MKSAYFFENWADYVKQLDEQRRLMFLDTFIKVCFDGEIPSATDGDAFLFYCLMRPAVEERDLRIKLSKSGVEARRLKRSKSAEEGAADTAVATAVDTAVATAVDTAVATYMRREEKRRDEKESESESVARSRKHTRTRSRSNSSMTSAAPSASGETTQGQAESPPSAALPNARPSEVDIRVAAHNLGVPDWFRDYYASEMNKVGWIERSSRKAGGTTPVTRSNVVLSMRGWWDQEKKNSAARVAAEAASSAEATPVTGAGRCAVPIATTEIV